MIDDHDAYIAEAPEDLRPLLVRLRAELADALPGAEEVIAYEMPGFRIGKGIVAGYAAFSKQCGLDLASSAIRSHADEIAAAGLKSTKTGVPLLAGHADPRRARRKTRIGLQKGSESLTRHLGGFACRRP